MYVLGQLVAWLFILVITALPASVVVILALWAWLLWQRAEQHRRAAQRAAIENARLALELIP